MAKINWYNSKDADKEKLLAMLQATGKTRGEASAWLRQNTPEEKAYQKRIRNYLETLPGAKFHWKEHSGGYQVAGIPDICMVYRGKFFGFEVKRPYGIGKPTKLQLETIEAINEAGGHAAVVTFVDTVEQMVKEAVAND